MLLPSLSIFPGGVWRKSPGTRALHCFRFFPNHFRLTPVRQRKGRGMRPFLPGKASSITDQADDNIAYPSERRSTANARSPTMPRCRRGTCDGFIAFAGASEPTRRPRP
jgi:hypothetical protein